MNQNSQKLQQTSQQWRNLSPVEKQKARQRLANFLTVAQLFPGYIHPQDRDVLLHRQADLSTISHLSSRIYQGLYIGRVAYNYFFKKTPFYFKTWMFHLGGFALGTVAVYHISDRLACDLYYNKVLIYLANRYNITQSELMNLQRQVTQLNIQQEKKQMMDTNKRSQRL